MCAVRASGDAPMMRLLCDYGLSTDCRAMEPFIRALSYCQIWCMAELNQAAFLPIFLSSMPSMKRTSVTTSAS